MVLRRMERSFTELLPSLFQVLRDQVKQGRGTIGNLLTRRDIEDLFA